MKERRKEEEINRSQGRRPLLHLAQLVFPIDRDFSDSGEGGSAARRELFRVLTASSQTTSRTGLSDRVDPLIIIRGG